MKRNRKIVRYNPPFSSQVEMDVGKKFLQFLDAHFPITRRYANLFDRSKVKISYCCMPDMKMLIK